MAFKIIINLPFVISHGKIIKNITKCKPQKLFHISRLESSRPEPSLLSQLLTLPLSMINPRILQYWLPYLPSSSLANLSGCMLPCHALSSSLSAQLLELPSGTGLAAIQEDDEEH